MLDDVAPLVGAAVRDAADGDQAIAAAAAQPFDLLLTDMVMPASTAPRSRPGSASSSPTWR